MSVGSERAGGPSSTAALPVHAMFMACEKRAALEHDPENCEAVFPRDKRVAFARRSYSNKKLERDDDSKNSRLARRTPIFMACFGVSARAISRQRRLR